MSRWPQHPEGFDRLQAVFEVDEPLYPSSYIQ